METKEIAQNSLSNLVLRKIVIEKIKTINSNDLRTFVEILEILELGKVKSLKKLSEIIHYAAPNLLIELGGEINKTNGSI